MFYTISTIEMQISDDFEQVEKKNNESNIFLL